jgi:2,3-bisphosphoglycerate-independent phosphoglycerate mutase
VCREPFKDDTMRATTPRPVMLAILDGFGWRDAREDNAVALAHKPNFDRLWAACPHAFLRTSGLDVGLPDGQMGNSEVGHMNIGAGRVVMQDLPRITLSLAEGELPALPAFRDLVAKLKASGGTCHMMGLVSPGGVHSHQDHAAVAARALVKAGIPVAVHAFTDGRDTPPRSGAEYLKALLAALPEGARVATVNGRYYAMDRDKRWDRVAKAYAAITDARGPVFADAPSVIDDAYTRDVTDEFVVPGVVGGYRGMKDGDGVFCFNFRADRVREILGALVDPNFHGFPRPRQIHFAVAVGLSHYSDELAPYFGVLYPPIPMTNLLGEIVAAAGLKQLRTAETEKFAHVTYFLNGGHEDPYSGEDRILVPSPRVATYDLQPQMSAPELTDRVVEAIESGQYDLIVLNFANCDMVGHTGSLPAAIKAVETVDTCLGRIAEVIAGQQGALLVTADHGNSELMFDAQTGGPHTAHTTNPVPVLLFGGDVKALHDGRLADIAPTLLHLMGLPQPTEMSGAALSD